jgi:integrase
MAKMHPVRMSRTLPIILSREEVSRLLDAAKNLKHQTALSVAYGAGLRVSEVTALKVGDIDSKRMLLRVEQGKGAKDRFALLPPLLLERLRTWWRFARAQGKVLPGGYLFPGLDPVDPMSTRQLNRAVHEAAVAARIDKRARRWSESIKALNIRRRGPYHARHSSVTWQLMLGKNLLWVAKQHGHSVEVMLRMYAAWLEGATEADIHAIKKAMEKRPDARAAFLDSRTAISAVNTVSNRVTQIVIRPPESPEFGSSLAVGKDLSDSSLRNDSKIKWRRGWDSNPRAGITRPSDFESAPL